MDESFKAILKFFKVTYYQPSLGAVIVFIAGCILLFMAVMYSLRKQSEKRKPINPCWIGNLFLEYCLKKGWVTKEGSGGKNSKWYPTERGRKELKEQFGIKIDPYDLSV